MIEIVILYVLNKYDGSIYRIQKVIDELFFAYLKTSCGTVNPAMKRLEKMGCVECVDRMSEGGMLTKIYSINSVGKKHLVESLLNLTFNNPYYVINDAKIALYCSDVLSVNELIEFKENILNNLELYKIKLERGLENQYIELNDLQKKLVKLTLDDLNEIINLL